MQEEIKYTIYKITNLLTGKFYIGKHKFKSKDYYWGSSAELTKDIKLYGKKNFKKEIIYFCKNSKEMDELEELLVNKDFCAREDTYNIRKGGNGGWDYINENKELFYNPFLDEDKKREIDFKAKKAMISKYGENWHKFLFLGKTHTDTERQKISERQKGVGNSFFGKKHSQDTKEKMKQKAKGKLWVTDGKVNYATTVDEIDDLLKLGLKRGRTVSKPKSKKENING